MHVSISMSNCKASHLLHILTNMLVVLSKVVTNNSHATFCLWGYGLAYALYVLCDCTTDCEVSSFTTCGYGSFDVCTKFGCMLYMYMKGVRHKEACTRVDSEGQKNCPSPCFARGSNPGSLGWFDLTASFSTYIKKIVILACKWLPAMDLILFFLWIDLIMQQALVLI